MRLNWRSLYLLAVASLLVTTVSGTFVIKRDILEEDEEGNSTALISGRQDDGEFLAVCGDDNLSDDNLYYICIFWGYETYEQVSAEDQASLDFNYTIGFSSLDCEDAASKYKCDYTEIGDENCTSPLVVKCSDEWSITAATTGTLILPIVLCSCIVGLILIMCVMDFKERKRMQLSSMKVRNSQKERWAANRIMSAISKRHEVPEEKPATPSSSERNKYNLAV